GSRRNPTTRLHTGGFRCAASRGQLRCSHGVLDPRVREDDTRLSSPLPYSRSCAANELSFYFVQFVTGLASACSLFLVASGLSIIFGVTRIVNFAHGAFYMLGACV